MLLLSECYLGLDRPVAELGFHQGGVVGASCARHIDSSALEVSEMPGRAAYTKSPSS